MTRSEAIEIASARFLAAGSGSLSALLGWYGLGGGLIALTAAQIFTVLSLLVLGSIRVRVGFRNAYLHPIGILTLVFLCPAQLATIVLAITLWA